MSDNQTTGLVEHVARAVCLQSITGPGKWPTQHEVERVDREWRKHEAPAQAAIRAVGEFLARKSV